MARKYRKFTVSDLLRFFSLLNPFERLSFFLQLTRLFCKEKMPSKAYLATAFYAWRELYAFLLSNQDMAAFIGQYVSGDRPETIDQYAESSGYNPKLPNWQEKLALSIVESFYEPICGVVEQFQTYLEYLTETGMIPFYIENKIRKWMDIINYPCKYVALNYFLTSFTLKSLKKVILDIETTLLIEYKERNK